MARVFLWQERGEDRFRLYHISGKCSKGDDCQYWHPIQEEKCFSKKEIQAAKTYCGKLRALARGRKGGGKRQEPIRGAGGCYLAKVAVEEVPLRRQQPVAL
mgnify:CR=1 FL=1